MPRESLEAESDLGTPKSSWNVMDGFFGKLPIPKTLESLRESLLYAAVL